MDVKGDPSTAIDFQEFDLSGSGKERSRASESTAGRLASDNDDDDDDELQGDIERAQLHPALDSVQLEPVLPAEVVCRPRAVCAAVARLLNIRHTSTVVAQLSALRPLPHLLHLRRVRRCMVDGTVTTVYVVLDLVDRLPRLPCLDTAAQIVFSSSCCQAQTPHAVADSGDNSSMTMVLTSICGDNHSALASLSRQLAPTLYVSCVSADRPLSRRQYELAAAMWPSHFHEDKQLQLQLSGCQFSCSERQQLGAYMALAVQVARRRSVTTAAAAEEEGLLDGSSNCARAAGSSDGFSNGSGSTDGCGTNSNASSDHQSGIVEVGCVIVDPVTRRVLAQCGDARLRGHQLHHATMMALEHIAAAAADAPLSPPPQQQPAVDSQLAGGAGAYLCTGYDAFITREPCAMCAMALLHSRIGRVFYGRPLQHGALGSRWHVHSLPAANHRFRVYRGLLSSQCCQLRTDDL